MPRARLELWTDYAAAGGRRLAPIVQVLAGPVESRNVAGEHSVAFTVHHDHPAVRPVGTPEGTSNFRLGQVVRLIPPTGAPSEHRISETTGERSGARRLRHIVARSVLHELGTGGLVVRADVLGHATASFTALGLTLSGHLEHYILPALALAGQAYWSVGSLAHNRIVEVKYDRDTPLSALRKLAAAGGNLEVEVTPTAAGYAIHLTTQIGAGLPLVTVQAKRNLTGLSYGEHSDDQATRVYAFGAEYLGKRASIGDATWDMGQSSSITGTVFFIQVRDAAGGLPPIAFDGQFLPLPPAPGEEEDPDAPAQQRYYLDVIGTTWRRPITNTTVDVNPDISIIEVESTDHPPLTTSWGSPTRCRIVADAAGREVLFADHPAMVAEHKVRVGSVEREDIPATDNLMPNPLGRVWPEGAPVPSRWGKNGDVTVTRETNPLYWENGGGAVRVLFPNGDNINAQGQAPTLTLPSAVFSLTAQGYLSFMARLTTLQGRVRVLALVTRDISQPAFENGSHTYIIPDHVGTGASDEGPMPDVTNIEHNVAEDIGVAAAWDLTQFPLYGGHVTLQIRPARGAIIPCECVIQGAQVTNTQDQMPLIEGSGGARLLQAANAHLALYATPGIRLGVSLADLSWEEAETAPYAALIVGAPIELRDPEMDVSLRTRLMGFTRDWSQRQRPTIELSSARTAITRLLAARRVTARPAPNPVARGDRGLTYAP